MLLRRHELLNSSLKRACVRPGLTAARRRRYATTANGADIAVLGGGVTGLATAYYLAKEAPRARITVYEAGPRVGGWLHSKRVEVDGGTVLFEQGPRTLRFTRPNGLVTAGLIRDLGLIDDTIFTPKSSAAARKRYIYYPDHLVQMPGPGQSAWERITSILTEPVFTGFIRGAFTEAFQRPTNLGDESIGSFISRRVHKAVAENMVSALLHGIYAGDVWQLSTKSLFPLQWHFEKHYGSMVEGLYRTMTQNVTVMPARDSELLLELANQRLDKDFEMKLSRCSVFAFRNGLQQLAKRLEARLAENGNVSFKPNTAVKSLEHDRPAGKIKITTSNGESQPAQDYVISTLYSKTLASLCNDPSNQPLLPTLALTPAVTVMVVNLYFRNPAALPVEGFGYLIPQSVPFEQNPERALGVVFDSCAAQGQDTVDGTKVTVMLGGHWWDGWPAYPSEEEGAAMARTVLARHLGVTDEPAAVNVNLQSNCIPQYTVGHSERMKVAHSDLVRHFGGRLRVAGNSYTGVGVNDCLRAARDVAKALAVPSGSGKTGLDMFATEPQWAEVTFGVRKDG